MTTAECVGAERPRLKGLECRPLLVERLCRMGFVGCAARGGGRWVDQVWRIAVSR
jgi:hypothetical protein